MKHRVHQKKQKKKRKNTLLEHVHEHWPTCAGLLGAAPAFADRAQRVSSSGPAQSLAGPAVPARSTTLSGCIPQASGETAKEECKSTLAYGCNNSKHN